MQILKATSREDFEKCFEVMKELRPHHSLKSFLAALDEMKNEGYRLLFLEDNDQAVCVAGYNNTL